MTALLPKYNIAQLKNAKENFLVGEMQKFKDSRSNLSTITTTQTTTNYDFLGIFR